MSETNVARMVYVTVGSPEEARAIGRVLVDERLAACVNIFEFMTSLYRWEGDLCEDRETVLIAKTRADLVDALTKRVVSLHSYDCPCVAVLPVVGGNARFLAWIADETADDTVVP